MSHDQDARGWKARAEQAEAKLATLEADRVAAAGDLPIPLPEPGTDMARMLHANRMLKYRADAAEKKAEAAEARLKEVEKDRDEWREHANVYDAHLNRVARALSKAGVVPIDDLAEKVAELAENAEARAERLREHLEAIASPCDTSDFGWWTKEARRALAADSFDKVKTFTLAADCAAPSKPTCTHRWSGWPGPYCLDCGEAGDTPGGN